MTNFIDKRRREFVKVEPNRGPLPVAAILDGSEIVRLVWGVTKSHAVRRAERKVRRQTEENSRG